jgi:hypothetical protein
LGIFTAKAAKFISDFGQTGPVQTPIALISEFSNAWRAPRIMNDNKIDFVIAGKSPYTAGDYQMYGLRDLLYPHCLQTEMVYEQTMSEDYALVPTPYGNSIDFLLSDVRKEALTRYGLLVWGGVPPETPSLVRDKLMWHVKHNQGRVVLFGATARSIFPELFEVSPAQLIGQGANVTYGSQTLTESSDFLLEPLRQDLDINALSMKVIASVAGTPLIVECFGGLILILSDYGINYTELLSPKEARWHTGQMITDIPYSLMKHAKQLINDEAARQTLFSVSNNILHYIVTRPQRGEYVLGLFNDKMYSEPFDIKSNIGSINSIEEVKLDDGKDMLKSAAGGAAYAPAGLRTSPDLPLNYGLSDDKHIEGRDFRLFRIYVNEQGIKDIPAIQYPNRPAGRVLSVAGLENIRTYLQGFSSFFQLFDGICISADALLSIEDSWLVEQAHWLDRRGVRIVVNCIGSNGEKTSCIIEKLSLMKQASKDLISSKPSTNLQILANQRGVHLLDPSEVNWIFKKDDTFNEKAPMNILDLYYHNEEDLYRDFQHFISGKDVPDIRGKNLPDESYPDFPGTKEMKNAYVNIGPDISSLKDYLEQNKVQLSKFKGIKINSTYILSKTKAALATDSTMLAQIGLKVIVDLRRDQMHFDRISFYPHIPNYKWGMELYSEIIDKMNAISAGDLILSIKDCGDMKNKDKYIRQRDKTWSTFADLAEQRNINLHLIFSPNLKFSPTADFSRPNVFVIEGEKGKSSSFTLVMTDGSIGREQ